MDKPFLNVATDKILSFDRFIVLAEYESEEEARSNLEHDMNAFKEKHKHEAWYKMTCPWAWATIVEV